MGYLKTSSLVAAITSAASVAAHGHLQSIIVDGVSYVGFDPTSGQNTDPNVGWATTQTDNGFVEPNSFSTSDIICHKDGTPATGHAQVAAGGSISLQWNTWPESHHGPMLDYLAPCNGACESVDPTSLEFFKIDEVGLIDGETAPGSWGSDVMISNNNTWVVQIPATIKAGNYVLRHETIALHSAGEANGAQSYPQCINLAVTGDGTEVPAGTLATELYTPTDPGIEVSIYTAPLSYDIPGPDLMEGVSSSVEQVLSSATAVGTATAEGGADTPVATGDASATTTEAAATSATSVADTPASTSAASSTAPTTLVTATQAPSATSVASTSAAAPTETGTVGAASLYGQCGGNNWTGASSCAEGTCTSYNDYYSQCVPA